MSKSRDLLSAGAARVLPGWALGAGWDAGAGARQSWQEDRTLSAGEEVN